MLNNTLLVLLQAVSLSVKNGSTPATPTVHQLSNHIQTNDQYHAPMALKSPDGAKDNDPPVCYDDLGCFPVSAPWLDTNRPVVLVPESPDKVNPGFCLFTRRNPNECQRLDYRNNSSILLSDFISNHKTYVIVHGFLEGGLKPWMALMKQRLLEFWDCNVIIVDWQGGSSPPYAQAVANIRLVGVVGAHLLASINKWVGHKTEFCHVIGHSLGAHVGGYIGNVLSVKFNLTLGRISGMDPAQPHFTNTDPVVRLDPSDAIFVDIIHTDAMPFVSGGLGIIHPVGHLDFYPNGGLDQPGCDEAYERQRSKSYVQGVAKKMSCDHVKSYQFYIESIMVPCEYTAIQCDSWENFTAGNCFGCRSGLIPNGRMCASMGFRAIELAQRDAAKGWEPFSRPDFNHVKLYTITGGTTRYCRSLYRITIRISNSTQSRTHSGESGKVSLKIDGVLGQSNDITVFKDEFYYPGKTYRRVVGDVQVGRPRTASVTFKHNTTPFNLFTWRLSLTRIHVQNITIDNLEEGMSVTLCPHTSEVVSEVAPAEFRTCSPTEPIVE